jgi:glycine hydroxymethyltransferase
MHPALHATLETVDPEIAELIAGEERRQRDKIRLIASENYVSGAVLAATGSVLTNKYSEGYPGKRYYEGQQFIDQVEQLCIDRAKALFGAEHANVQPYSGSPANLAVYLAFVKPGDTVMGMGLPAGGHLTHGWNVSATGQWFRSMQYGVRRDTHRIDLDEVRDLARKERPRLLFAGGTAIPRTIDFAAFAEIAREVGAVFVADMAHIAGLVAGGAHPSPVPHADVVSTTTHKTLRGPRGGLLLCTAGRRAAVDKAVFPGLQGGPHNHTTASPSRSRKRRPTSSSATRTRSSPTRAPSPQASSSAAGRWSPAEPTTTSSSLISPARTCPARTPPRPSTPPGSSSTTTPCRSTRASRSIRPASASAPRRSRAAA